MALNQFTSPEGDLDNYLITEYWLIDQWVGDTLWAWGYNYAGILGDNTSTNRSTPVTTFAGGTNWKQVHCASGRTGAIKTDGTLWNWGTNAYGELGNSSNTSSATPVTTSAFIRPNWRQVSGRDNHTAAIKTDGTLWTWGRNLDGELGTNSFSNRNTPVTTFAYGTDWKQVACGYRYTAAIKTDGTLWMWGGNAGAKLGINQPGFENRCTPVTTFAGGVNWKQVACGQNHTAAIKTDGTLWIWGVNTFGRLGDNTFTNRSTPVTTFAGGTNWKQVACGFRHTAAIKTDGTLWIWGSNYYGEHGNNTLGNRETPITTFIGGTNWKQVSCGGYHTAAIKTDGTLWIWGRNHVGQIGNNLSDTVLTPVTTFIGGTNWKQVSCGTQTTAAITSGTNPTLFVA